MVLYQKADPYIVRVPTITDVSDKLQRFDTDNLYPQRAEMLMRRSYTLRAVVERIADFINGEGFADVALGGMIVNKKGLKGQSLNKVLTVISKPFTAFETVPMHINYNLNCGISSITPIPFSFIRFGLKNVRTGIVDFLAYSTNWERDGRKELTDRSISFYPTFNPDPQIVGAQIEAAGGIMNYKGQILYLTPEDGQYPVATFDSVFDDSQTQVELGTFKVSNIQNSFLSTMALLYPAKFGSTQETFDFQDLVANKTGAMSAGSRIGLQDPTGTKKITDLIVNLQPVNLDKLFELTEQLVKEAIIENYAFPKILLGITPDGLFAQANLEEAYTYANSITRNRRAALSEAFSTIMQYWDGPEGPIQSDCRIIEQRYTMDGDSTAGGGANVNDAIQNMTGMQAINFARILRKYGEGGYKRAIAHSLLQQGFGLSDEEINTLLDAVDQAAEDETGKPPTPIKDLTEVALKARRKKWIKCLYHLLNNIYETHNLY